MSTPKIAGGTGISLEADFERGTWLFAMEPGFAVSAGRFSITHVAAAPTAVDGLPASRSIISLGVTSRSIQLLQRHGLSTIADLTRLSVLDLMQLPDVGRRTIQDVEDGLARIGLALAKPGGREEAPGGGVCPPGPWTRSASTPPPVGVRVALYTPGLLDPLEEFTNTGPEVYPDWSKAESWWMALPDSVPADGPTNVIALQPRATIGQRCAQDTTLAPAKKEKGDE